MSTNDVPGAVPANNDQLQMGCWAEHDDKASFIFVYNTENGRVIYTMFDVGKDPVIEYRDAMPEKEFKDFFSWKAPFRTAKKGDKEKWTWHDKTPFPWDKVIKHGARQGVKYASAFDQLSAAERVARSLQLEGQVFDEEKAEHMTSRTRGKLARVAEKLAEALRELGQ